KTLRGYYTKSPVRFLDSHNQTVWHARHWMGVSFRCITSIGAAMNDFDVTRPVAMREGHLHEAYTNECQVCCEECGPRFVIGYPLLFKTDRLARDMPLEALRRLLENHLRQDHKENRDHASVIRL